LALRLLRDLHLTQVGRVGTPQPIMEYWLSDGKAPQGLVSGLKVVTLDTASLRAEQVQGQWCVRDSYRVLFNFGSHGDECQQALGTIQRHGFTQVGFVGRASPVMLVFLANPTPISGSPLHAQAAADTSLRSTVPPGGVRPDHGLTHASGTQPSNPPIGPAALPQGRQLGLPGSGAGDLTPLGDRVPTHWRQVQLRQEGKDWKLVLGGYTLASFGPSERDARTALAAVQFYRFTDQYLVGHPKPAFSYFLVNGQAPHGLMFGLNTTAFRSESLTVQHTDDGWMVGEGIRPLLAFGDKEEEAKTALQAIQRFHFDTLCRIGSDDSAGMTFLVRSR
jgi:hypothetical protein